MARYADIDVLLEHLTTSDEGNFRTAITQWLEMHQVEDVAPVIHAHWIELYDPICYVRIGYEHLPKTIVNCSNCNKEVGVKTPYCPGCGAKMDEEVDNA